MGRTPPLLILSDAVSSPTGLGRIAREIAVRADANLKDVCRIATLGCGGPGSRRFNFPQYAIEGMNDFVILNLPEVWEDWAGSEAGILLAIWDASRLGWLSRPEMSCENPVLQSFLTSAKMKRWIYAPLDACGPNGLLSYPLIQSLLGFDRVLAYSEWAENILRGSLGEKAAQKRDLDSVPHGIDPEVFHPYEQVACKANFSSITGSATVRGLQMAVLSDKPLVGAVATNQSRKDWGLWAECCALFLSRHPNAWFWIHTDSLERYWSIPALLMDFGLIDRTLISVGHLSDQQMAKAYSACDLTLGIGAGEGFGFPIFESLFCGTPCIHGNYGGAPEHMSEPLLVNPARLWNGDPAYRYEGLYCCKRPVFSAIDWANTMDSMLGKRMNRPGELDWENVWPRFEAWFRKGLKAT